MRNYLFRYWCATLLSLLLVGCSTKPKDPPINSIRPIDQSVAATVQMNLKTDMELASCVIDVKAENNLVVMRGTVPSDGAKKKAQDIAAKSVGVDKVANHLEVQAPPE